METSESFVLIVFLITQKLIQKDQCSFRNKFLSPFFFLLKMLFGTQQYPLFSRIYCALEGPKYHKNGVYL